MRLAKPAEKTNATIALCVRNAVRTDELYACQEDMLPWAGTASISNAETGGLHHACQGSNKQFSPCSLYKDSCNILEQCGWVKDWLKTDSCQAKAVAGVVPGLPWPKHKHSSREQQDLMRSTCGTGRADSWIQQCRDWGCCRQAQ